MSPAMPCHWDKSVERRARFQIRVDLLTCYHPTPPPQEIFAIMPDIDYSDPQLIERERRDLFRFFAEFPFFNLIGLELIDVEPGHARLSVGWRSDLCQPAGIMHGGILASLIDTSIAHSILLTPLYLAAKPQGGRIVSVDLRVKYLRPVSSGRVVCDAQVTRLGRQIIHTAATVVDAESKEVATGDSIYMLVSQERLQKRGD